MKFSLNIFDRNWLLKEMVFSYSFSSFKIFRREPRSLEKWNISSSLAGLIIVSHPTLLPSLHSSEESVSIILQTQAP